MKRINKTDYYLGIARAVAMASTCVRRQYGAVIVRDNRILGTGFNGASRGEEHCTDRGTCYRILNDIPHGTQYETCVSVHAEQNAIINAQCDVSGATLYLAGLENGQWIEGIPCVMCSRVIKNAGIKSVITHQVPK